MARSVSPPHPAVPPEPTHLAVELADVEVHRAADLLHDGPVQSLVAAHFAAEATVRGGDPELARAAVQAALVELRRTLWHLRPRGGDGAGLLEVLGQLSDRLVEAGRAPLVTVLDEDCAAGLAAPVVSTAFRLVQAAALAAPASVSVLVALHRGGGTVVLDIRGGALDPAQWAARVAAVGGALTATGSTGYRLAVPAPPPRPEAIP